MSYLFFIVSKLGSEMIVGASVSDQLLPYQRWGKWSYVCFDLCLFNYLKRVTVLT